MHGNELELSVRRRLLGRRSCLAAALVLIAAALHCLAAPLLAEQEKAPRRPPNIVFILADDLGWRDLACYGSRYYETPHIDRLAQRSLTFRQAYSASPLCSPTRASILTGLFPARIGITVPVCHIPETVLTSTVADKAAPNQKYLQVQSATRLKQEYVTLAESLKAAGYATAHLGKWHLGPEPYSALDQGFEVDLPHTPVPGPVGGYLAPWKFWPGQGQPGEHIEDRMAQEAVKFIKAHRQRPFFLNYWAFSVHAPFDSKAERIEHYRAKPHPPGDLQRSPTYAAMVQSLDDAVGTLVRTLDEEGLWDRTVVIFTSDNGGNMYDEVDGVPPTSNDPLRSGKASFYEGGTRVPCLIHWPGVTRPGSTSDTPMMSIDYFPTFCEMLGIAAPPVPFDGRSLAPLLRGQPFDRGPLFCHFPHPMGKISRFPASWVREGDWKLIRLYNANADQTDHFELYNLKEDLGESHDLAAREPKRVESLRAKLAGFLKDSHAVLPRPNPVYDPTLDVEIGGWRASGADARVRAEGGNLVVHSRGNDPQIMVVFRPPVPGPLAIEFRMKSSSRGAGAVYWTRGNQAFHRDRAVFFTPQHDGQWHDYRFQLATGGPIATLRIDPSSGPGEMAIESIRLLSPQGAALKAWKFGGK